MTDGQAQEHLVVVGSSAGGIEALSHLVAGLPADFEAPVVVAQHLDPRRTSHLAEILGRHTTLPVVTIDDRADLVPGHIYVVPASRHVAVTDHAVELIEQTQGPAPSVDRLMTTAAGIFGERLIAVVLTGSGSDGADGARRVKEAGGTVLIQDPSEARFPSMPASLEPTIVDLVAGIEGLGPLLGDLVRGTYRPGGSDDEERALERFLASVRERTGIDFSRYKRQTIVRRLQRRMAAVRTERLRDYARHAASHPEEYQRLVGSFLIKVTDFFRDAELWEHLRSEILPQLIDEGRRNGQELRIWCAGCATGEEAYSLAILVADALGDELGAWTVRIFATDLDPAAVAFARRGRYRAGALEGLPQDVVERHFTRLDGHYEVRKQIRALTVFGEHDLAQRAPFPRIDMALCRNVLIYFTPGLRERVLSLFAFSIRPGGYLVLGKAEGSSPLPELFATHQARLRILQRRATEAPVPATVSRNLPRAPARATRPAETADARPRSDLAGASEAALAALPAGIVVVNERYGIEAINPAARRLLGVHSSAVGQDLLHLVARLPSAELRDLADAALRGQDDQRVLALTLTSAPGDETAAVEVQAAPVAGGRRRALLVVRPSEASGPGARAPLDGEADMTLASRLEALEELSRRLTRDNEELTTVNAELRAANEEMVVANEEAQAATEEVETLNEELQATNEELETLNEELQATIEELNTTGEDLQARAVELQLLATHLEDQRRITETERLRFERLVGALGDAVALIDGSGAAVIQNDAYDELFERHPIEPLSDDGAALGGGDLRARVARGETFMLQFAALDGSGRRRWYEAYGQPVEEEMGTGGGILVVHDTTDLSLRRLQEEFVAIVAHELRTPLTALRGYLQLLRGGRSPAGDGRLLGLATAQAERLVRLVDELFDVTRADTGRLEVRPEPTPLGPLVEQTVEIAQSLSEQRIVVEGLDGSTVEIDGARIQQVLLNLITNAQRHASRSPTITLRFRRQRRWLAIEIEDHGPGMSDEVQASLFARFNVDRASPARGLGLGLYISREIVRAHGGTIEADSVPGEGTTFTIRLPLARDRELV